VPLDRVVDRDLIDYGPVVARLDRPGRLVDITVNGPGTPPPAHPGALAEQLRSGADGGADWPLRVWRALDDLLLRLRFNEPGLGTLVLRTAGDPHAVLAWDAFLAGHGGDWLVRELRLLAKRTLKRLDLTGRSLFAVIDEGSCFAGSLAELALAADRTYHLDTSECRSNRGDDTDGSARGTCSGGGAATSNPRAPSLVLSDLNFGPLPMGNGLTRLQSRFLADPAAVERLAKRIGEPLEALEALDLGLVTFAPDDLDWDDELRVALEERASLSPDALTGLEANCRFAGPETMETKIFGRLSAWQNWIFQRPNAVGDSGALKLYGTGQRAEFDRRRV
jgi:benzoyl-CoA-dihydrodiol lyase